MASLIPVTTTRIGDHLPLLDLLNSDAPLSWVRNGEGLVGWGVHATTTVSGKDRFEKARTWWHHQLETFAVANSVHGSGTGPVLFTSFSFDRNEESVLVIPKVIVGQRVHSHGLLGLAILLSQCFPNLPHNIRKAHLHSVAAASLPLHGKSA